MRIVRRAWFQLRRAYCVLLSKFSHRCYMAAYTPLLKSMGCRINGTPRYIGSHVAFDDHSKITLGDRVVISDHTHLLTHDYSVTTAFIAIGEPPETDIALVRGIEIGDNVFIGRRSIIMPNTRIGNNVIIGAGSVVRGTIEDGSIVLGNPAQKVGNIADQAHKWKKYIGTEELRADKE